MAAIALQTGKNVSPVNDYQPLMRTYIAAVALTTGQAVAIDTAGKAVAAVAGTTVAGTLGVVVGNGAGIGYPVTVLERGVVDGYNVAAMAYGDIVYNGAAGVIDTAGTVAIGRVVSMSEQGGSKAVEILL
jgi:hypothetical protein